MNPAHKNPTFRQGINLTKQPSCSSHSFPSPSLGGALEATGERRTKNMGFLEHEKEAPTGELQKIICVGFN